MTTLGDVLSIEDILGQVPLDRFGLLGGYHSSMGTRPSPLELCRFAQSNPRITTHLLSSVENISSRVEWRRIKRQFPPNANDTKKLDSIIREIAHQTSRQNTYVNISRRLLKVASPTQLRSYQVECVEKLEEEIMNEGSSLLVLPTGAGKTRTAMEAIRGCIDSSTSPIHVLWIVHATPLCSQAEHAFEKIWVAERTVTGNSNLWLNKVFDSGITPTREFYEDGTPSFTISTPDSVDSWGNNPPCNFDLIVVDEAHHGIEEQHNRVFDKLPHTHRLGLTATPLLSTNRVLFNQTYRTLIYPNQYLQGRDWDQQQEKMIEDNFLSSYDISEKQMNNEAADFVRDDKYNVGKPWHNQAAPISIGSSLVVEMHKEGLEKILVFCDPKTEQCEVIASVIRDQGIPAETIYGKLPRDTRRSRITEFNVGRTNVLVSMNVLREGVDLPLVDGIMIMRRGLTNEDPMFTQMIGRGLRGPESGGTPHCKIYHIT